MEGRGKSHYKHGGTVTVASQFTVCVVRMFQAGPLKVVYQVR